MPCFQLLIGLPGVFQAAFPGRFPGLCKVLFPDVSLTVLPGVFTLFTAVFSVVFIVCPAVYWASMCV